MEISINDYPQYMRSDPLTGVGNPLAFFEWLLSHTNAQPIPPFTLISLDVRNLEKLNESHGYAAGDAALRWAALVLLEEAGAQVYRIGGDEFVGVLTDGSTKDHTKLVERVYSRLTAEANQVNLAHPAALLAMIHYSGLEEISPGDVLGVIYGALIDIKQDHDQSFKVFDAATTKPATTLSGLINDMVGRMVSLGAMLDKSQQLAYTDSITGLPNMHATFHEFSATIEQTESTGKLFAILLLDGDDLRRYNKIGYLAGDEMIERLGSTLKGEMRPNDFLARWRTGDEFLILLQDTSVEQALSIADRIRESVIDASKEWTYPITISVGVAGYPQNGTTAEDLLHQAELALSQAKNLGKNQVFVNE
jgi:diguanylate cyclase (GGDEF)-like protein